MKRHVSFAVAIVFYIVGMSGLFLLILWIGNLLPFLQLDRPASLNLPSALAKNISLIALLGIQHSVLAHLKVKRWWTKQVSAHLERSIYVCASGLICLIIAFFWEPMTGDLWNISSMSFLYYLLYGLYFFGFIFLVTSLFLINHFEVFGLLQGYNNLIGRAAASNKFREVAFYKVVRQPVYLGFLLILWSTPYMSLTHFSLALSFTVYIYIGVYLEESDLKMVFGSTYRNYKKRVPKIIPFCKFRADDVD